MKILYFITCLLFSSFLHAQIISTVAGNGMFGNDGDGGQATATRITNPRPIAADLAGNIYFSAAPYTTIRKVSTSGIITTIAGNGTSGHSGDGGPATNAQLNYLSSLALDTAGYIYAVESANYCVRKVSTSGIITTIAGTSSVWGYSGDGGPATAARLDLPQGVAVDWAGNVYIADYYNNVIRKVSGGIITTFAGTGHRGYGGDGGPATAAWLSRPTSVAVDTIGNVFIGDSGCMLRKVNTVGIITTIAGTGVGGYSGDGGPATAAKFVIDGIAIDGGGSIYTCDQSYDVIRVINTAGIVYTYAGTGFAGYNGDGIPANTAWLNGPWTVAADRSGFIYVADADNHRIRKISATTAVPQLTGSSCISVLPNPATDVVHIQGAGKAAIKLYNATGMLVAQAANTDHISITALPPGMYFLRLFNDQGALIYQDKVIKN